MISLHKYEIIYADPPWRFKNWSMEELATRGEEWAKRMGRSPYDVMDTSDICKLPVKYLANKDCVLFMWATFPKLEDALMVVRAWGFEYKSVAFTWVKQNPTGLGFHFGLGYWTRGNAEICLLATKGKPKRVNDAVRQLIFAPVMEHSRKPDEIVRGRILELLGPLPRIELFARRKVEGWDAWGNQVESDVDLEELQQMM